MKTAETTDYVYFDLILHNSKISAAEADAIDASRDFAEVMRKLAALQESPRDRAARLSREAKLAAERRHRASRINELRGLIAQLTTKLASSNYSTKVQAQLSDAQRQLYWLLMGF